MALILSSQSNLIFNIFSSKLYKIRVGHFKIQPLDYLDKKIKALDHPYAEEIDEVGMSLVKNRGG